MANPIRDVVTTLVQTAGDLPDTDAGWTTQRYVHFVGGSEGAGQVLGEATFEQVYGDFMPFDADLFAQVGIAPNTANANQQVTTLNGLFVRVLALDSAGTVVIDGDNYAAFWYGIIHAQHMSTDGNKGGVMRWMAVGIAGVLEQIVLKDGWVNCGIAPSVNQPINLGYLPAFNKRPAGDMGVISNLAPDNRHPFEIGNVTVADVWTAFDIVQYLLSMNARPSQIIGGLVRQSGPRWVLSDPLSALAYKPEESDFHGQTLLQAINTLISARRGFTWWTTVSGGTITINVSTLAPVPISTVDYTLPAASPSGDIDLTDSTWFADFSISTDYSTVYDIIEIQGEHPWIGITLAYTTGLPVIPSALKKGWTDAEEVLWNQDTKNNLYDHVWRRFLLDDTWDFSTYDGTAGVRDLSSVSGSGDPLYGAFGWDGNRQWRGSQFTITPSSALKVERLLPIYQSSQSVNDEQHHRPVVVLNEPSTSYSEDMSTKWEIGIEEAPAAVVINDGKDGEDIADFLADDGNQILVTIGLREPDPIRVSWVRDPSLWPRSVPRVKMIQLHHIEQWAMPANYIVGGDEVLGTGPVEIAGDTVFFGKDDVPRARAILALATQFYGQPSVSASFTQRGILDYGTWRAGYFVGIIKQGGSNYSVQNTITRRSWTRVRDGNVERWDTSYETERVKFDLEAIK